MKTRILLACALLGGCAEERGINDEFEDAYAEVEEFNDGKYDLFGPGGIDVCKILDPIFELGEQHMRAAFVVGVSGIDVVGEGTGRGGYTLVFDIFNNEFAVTGHAGHSVIGPPWATTEDTDEPIFYNGVAFGFEGGVRNWHGMYAAPLSSFDLPFIEKAEAEIPPLFVSAVDEDGDGIFDEALLPPQGVYGFSLVDQPEIEFEIDPMPTTPPPVFVGTDCTEDDGVCADFIDDATGDESICEPHVRDDIDWAMCTIPCAGLCPDLGDVTTMCVSVDGGQTGICLPEAGPQNLGCATIPGTGPEEVERFVGDSGVASRTATICTPTGSRPGTVAQPYRLAVRQYYDFFKDIRFFKVGKHLRVALVDETGAECPETWPEDGSGRDCVLRFGDPEASQTKQAIHTAYALCKATDGCNTSLSFQLSVAALAIAVYRDSGFGYESVCGDAADR